jgi:tRNA(Ile)-lysidine synthase
LRAPLARRAEKKQDGRVSDFLQRLENNIRSRELLPRGQKILVAVSGGADSMALLHSLNSLPRKSRWNMCVAHFNHQLRGRSSDADERLVRKTAAALKLPVVVGTADVKQFARESRLSIEMAARQLRHEFFVRAACERKISTVALAHHADDQVELFFLRLLRGAGGEGLAGMKWRAPSPANQKITLVRPLLDCSKAELLQFVREHKIRFREDATNFSLDAKRNRIRNELLPLIRKHYQPGLSKTVLRLMEIIGAESDFVGEAARNAVSSLWLDPVRPQAERYNFETLPVAVQRRVLQSQLVSLGLTADFDLIESLRQSAGTAVSVGSKYSVLRNPAGKVTFQKIPSVAGFNPNVLVVNLAHRVGGVVFDATRLAWKFDARKNFKRLRGETGGEFFDADKVGSSILLRHWRTGDVFQPIGLKLPVKLQDLFTNAKILRARRHELIVAEAAAGEIFWVEGLRISEKFKLTPETKRRLAWRWRRPQSV